MSNRIGVRCVLASMTNAIVRKHDLPASTRAMAKGRFESDWGDGALGLVYEARALPGRRGGRFVPASPRRAATCSSGIVLDHSVEQGNPPDAPQLAPAVKRVTNRGAHAADRHRRPRLRRSQGRPPAHRPRRQERDNPAQRETIAGATCRGTPKSLPPHHQMAHRQRRPHQPPQTRLRLGPHPHRRHRGHRIWTKHRVLAHNLVKVSALAS